MSDCYIYAMAMEAPIVGLGSDDVIKIGVSYNPDARLSQIRTSSPFYVQMAGKWLYPTRRDAMWVESRLHQTLDKYRRCGEWFFIPYPGAATDIILTAGRCWAERHGGDEGGLIRWLECVGLNQDDIKFVFGEITAEYEL